MNKPCSDPQPPSLRDLCNVPNTITCCNLISGCIATYFAFQSEFRLALLFIVIGAVFDFFDGMVARHYIWFRTIGNGIQFAIHVS